MSFSDKALLQVLSNQRFFYSVDLGGVCVYCCDVGANWVSVCIWKNLWLFSFFFI